MKTRSWEKAADELARQEQPKEPLTIEEALKKFIADCESRNLAETTIRKHRGLRDSLLKFARSAGLGSLDLEEFTVDDARAFRQSWRLSPRTATKQLERLRAFFNFCVSNDWIGKNPAKPLKAPKVKDNPTVPFTEEEMIRILAAVDVTGFQNTHARRLRALILLMRHSGLRIGDTVALERSRVRDGKLFLYTQKTGVPVWCPLPPFVIDALESSAHNSVYYFWSGEGKAITAVKNYRQDLYRIFEKAGIRPPAIIGGRPRSGLHGKPHQFRDTFSVSLLANGTDIRTVQLLLGHSSVKTTEKHYSPFVREIQKRIEQEVRRSWQSESRPAASLLA